MGTVVPQRRWPGQLAVLFSMESARYYACQGDPKYLSNFDVTMVRSCSTVVPMPPPALGIHDS